MPLKPAVPTVTLGNESQTGGGIARVYLVD